MLHQLKPLLVAIVVPQQFHSKNGPAWLFSAVVNVIAGPPEERLMTTGMHIVSDISCTRCMSLVGWKYVSTHKDIIGFPTQGHR